MQHQTFFFHAFFTMFGDKIGVMAYSQRPTGIAPAFDENGDVRVRVVIFSYS